MLPRSLNVLLSWHAPGLSDEDLRSRFDRRPSAQRRAYYRAANLIASEMAEAALRNGHVVMDRYWTSTVAFTPLDDDSQPYQKWHGRYPPEIRNPDIVILLTVDEENRAKRMRERGEPITTEEKNSPGMLHTAKLSCRFTASLTRLRSIPVVSHRIKCLKLCWLT